MPTRTRTGRGLLLVERVLFVVALAALGWYATTRVTTILQQRADERRLEQLRERQVSSETPAKENPAADVPLPTPTGRPRPARDLVGRITVPRLGLSAVVREGADDRTLDRAVGHIPETAWPGERGNVALAAHRDGFFRPLKDVRKGDSVVLTTPEGEFKYIVRETRVVPPTDVSVLDPTSGPTLTLVTCYPFDFVGKAPKRFIVRAEAIDAAPPAVAALGPVVPPATAAILTPAKHVSRTGAVSKAPVKKKPTVRRAASRKPAAAKKPEPKKKGMWRKLFGVFR